jgi:hypothetical protein
VPNYNNSPNFVAYNTRLTCGTCCSVGHLFIPSCPLLSPTSIPNVYRWSHAEGARPPAHAEGARPPAAGACGGSSTSCRRRRRRVETELDRRHARRELDLWPHGGNDVWRVLDRRRARRRRLVEGFRLWPLDFSCARRSRGGGESSGRRWRGRGATGQCCGAAKGRRGWSSMGGGGTQV